MRIATRILLLVLALGTSVIPLAAQSTKKNGLTGWEYFQQKRYTDALELLKQDHRMWPKIHEILDGIGWCQYFLGDYDAAEQSFKQALALNDSYRFSQMGLEAVKTARLAPITQAESLLAQAKYSDAIDAFTDILGSKTASDEQKARALRGKGYAHYYLGQYQQALKDLTRAIRNDNEDGLVLAGIGLVQFARKNYNEAESVLDQSLKLDRTNLDAALTFAWCAMNRGNVKVAEERFRRAIEGFPASWGALLGLGWCRDRQKDDEGALAAFRRAIALSSQAGTADVLAWARRTANRSILLLDYGFVLIEGGNYTLAASSLAALPPDLEPDVSLLGQALAALDSGDSTRAATLAKSLLDRQKDPVRELHVSLRGGAKTGTGQIRISASGVLGWALLRIGDTPGADACFARALERDPANADAACGKGYVRLAQGNYAEAETAFARSLEILPGYTGAVSGKEQVDTWRFKDYALAWTKLERGEIQEAETLFNGLRDDPAGRFPKTRQDLLDYSLGVVARRRGLADKAQPLFASALAKNPALTEALVGLGWAELELKRLPDAIKTLEAAIAARPGDYEAHRLCARALVASDQAAAAREKLAQWTKTFYLDTEMGELYGRLLMDDKRFVEARIAFAAVVANDPQKIPKKEIDAWIAEHKEFLPLHGALGWALYGQGRWKEALERFKAAAEAEPGEATHQKGLALAQSALGDDAAARVAADAYVATLDKTTTAAAAERRSLAMTLAWNSYAFGNFKAALDAFQKLEKSELTKEGADLLNALGWTWLGMGKPQKAREYFLRALSIAPRLESALQGIEACNKAGGSDT